ncbi:MAG: type II toxin-antitoxin system HicA family toxin [Alphaproteobacteria bacterium]
MGKSYHSREVIRLLLRHGFVLRSVKGSHHKYVKGSYKTIVPHPKKDLKIGTLMSILELAGLSLTDLEN